MTLLTAVGSIDGHLKAKQDVCILWVDAHTDLNTNNTSGSGNVHGMSMALLASELSDYWPQLPGMEWLNPRISLKNVAYIGKQGTYREHSYHIRERRVVWGI